MQDQVRIGRVIGLLDEVKDELSSVGTGWSMPEPARLRLHEKITQAQNLLVGAEPTKPEDN